MKKLISFSLFMTIVLIAWAASAVSASAENLAASQPVVSAKAMVPGGRGYWKWNRRLRQYVWISPANRHTYHLRSYRYFGF